MQSRTLTCALILGLTGMMLVGCGQNDEIPEASESKQTTALVPGTVSDDDLSVGADGSMAEGEVIPPVSDQGNPEQNTNPADASAPPSEGVALAEIEPPAEKDDGQLPATPVGISNSGRYSLQLGSFTVLAIAEEKAADLRKLGHEATIEQAEVGGQLYHRLFIRGIADRKSAENLGEELHSSLGFSYLVKRK